MRVIKILVRDRWDGLVSFGTPVGYALRYYTNVVNYPIRGHIFCFDTLDNAQAFASEMTIWSFHKGNDVEFWECEASNPYCPIFKRLCGSSLRWDSFWKNGIIPREDEVSYPVVKGTILCTSVKLLERR
jgi:hypothetical protein